MYTLYQDDKKWIESHLFNLVAYWDLPEQKTPFYNPQTLYSNFSATLGQKDCMELADSIIAKWDIRKYKIQVSIVTDQDCSNESHSFSYNSILSDQFSKIDKLYSGQDFYFKIVLSQSLLSNKNKLICDINRYVALVALHETGIIDTNNYAECGLFVDMACIFKGWGLPIINELQDNVFDYYLPDETIRYSNYLLYATVVMCALHQASITNYLGHLPTKYHNALLAFEKQLVAGGNLPDKERKIARLKVEKDLFKKRTTAYLNHDFTSLAVILDELEASGISKTFIATDRGYLNLQLKNYTIAIDYISQALQLGSDLYLDYNNRGYCKLQLGLMEDAYQDFAISQEYNPRNPFLYRNLGAYFLKLNDLPKALKYFNDAMVLKPDLDLVYFYLAHCHYRMGHLEKAKSFAEISRQRNEYNDSLEPELDF